MVGGGAVGASVAFDLARRGLRTLVVDRGEPGGGSTARSAGLVDVMAADEPTYARVRARAVDETEAWLGAAGALRRVGWERCGSLTPARDAVTAARLAARRSVLAAAGVAAAWWDEAAARQREPALAPGVVGALVVPGDACLDPRAYLAVLREQARAAGAAWRDGAEVRALRPTGAAWDVELADGGRCAARRVVVAAGVWSPALLPGLPVRPVRGTVLTTVPQPRLLSRYTPGLRQLPDGRFWIGGSHEDAGFDLTPDPAVVAALRAQAAALVPALSCAAVECVRTGLRPMPADGRPLAGAWPGASGLYVAVTHSGVTLARWLGRRLAALVAGEDVPELTPYCPAPQRRPG